MVEALLVALFENVAESFGRDEGGLRALALDERVGGKRRAVNEDADIARREARLREDEPMPSITPSSGAWVVVRTLPLQRLGPASSTISVKVPPISAASLIVLTMGGLYLANLQVSFVIAGNGLEEMTAQLLAEHPDLIGLYNVGGGVVAPSSSPMS